MTKSASLQVGGDIAAVSEYVIICDFGCLAIIVVVLDVITLRSLIFLLLSLDHCELHGAI